MKQYMYDGPVLEFDKVIASNWAGSTCAVSEKKARCNLTYQFKQQSGKVAASKITLPGLIREVDERSYNDECQQKAGSQPIS